MDTAKRCIEQRLNLHRRAVGIRLNDPRSFLCLIKQERDSLGKGARFASTRIKEKRETGEKGKTRVALCVRRARARVGGGPSVSDEEKKKDKRI